VLAEAFSHYSWQRTCWQGTTSSCYPLRGSRAHTRGCSSARCFAAPPAKSAFSVIHSVKSFILWHIRGLIGSFLGKLLSRPQEFLHFFRPNYRHNQRASGRPRNNGHELASLSARRKRKGREAREVIGLRWFHSYRPASHVARFAGGNARTMARKYSSER